MSLEQFIKKVCIAPEGLLQVHYDITTNSDGSIEGTEMIDYVMAQGTLMFNQHIMFDDWREYDEYTEHRKQDLLAMIKPPTIYFENGFQNSDGSYEVTRITEYATKTARDRLMFDTKQEFDDYQS